MLLALSFHRKTCLGCCQGSRVQEEERNSVFPNSKPHHCVDTRWSEVSHQNLSWFCVTIPSSRKSCRQAGVHESTAAILPPLPFHHSSEFGISEWARRSCLRPPASLIKYILKFIFQSCFFLQNCAKASCILCYNFNCEKHAIDKTTGFSFVFQKAAN